MKKFTIIIGIILLVRLSECCDCQEKHVESVINEMSDDSKENTRLSNSKIVMDKRQLHETEYETSDVFEYGIRSTTTKRTVLNENHFELNETEFSTAITDESSHCPFYQKTEELDMSKMVDVWRLVFYRSTVDLGCFKVLIKSLSNEARLFYQDKYGNYNDTIKWNDCVLQLTSNGNGAYETHFLQAVANASGLLDNIILSEESNGNLSILTLQDHSPDQWLALDKLLLMRDCDNGDVIIFSRIPNNPTQTEINDALTLFGEDNKDGTWACSNKSSEQYITMSNPKYQIIS